MGNADWCAWCNRTLRGKKSFDVGLCYKCRNTKEGKEMIEKWEMESYLKTTRNHKPTILDKVYEEIGENH